MPAHDVTVTGSFTINKYKLTYMVDDAEYKTYEVEFGATITPEPAPTKEGYTFSGWSEIPETMPAHDVTVTGTFTMDDPVIDNVVYEVTEEGVVVSDGSNSSGDVVIPASVVVNGQTYQVTAIGENAFKDNKGVTSLSIPDGVVKVGAGAFDGCSNLVLISIGKDVATIGEKAFANIGTSTNAPKRVGTEALIVKCYPVNVPTTAMNAFEGSSINNGLLLVNDNSSTAYKATMPWNKFGTIMGFEEAAGINAVWANDKQVRIYTLDGKAQNEPLKGINIINGKKYVVK